MKPGFRRGLTLAILFASVLALTNLLVKRETLVILIPGGDRLVVTSPLMYSLKETLLISVASAAAGFSLALLLAERGVNSTSPELRGLTWSPSAEEVLRMLDPRDREIVRFLVRKGGEALQREVWAELGMSRVTASRRLDSLEERGVVVRERIGGTYRVRLSDWLRRLVSVGG